MCMVEENNPRFDKEKFEALMRYRGRYVATMNNLYICSFVTVLFLIS